MKYFAFLILILFFFISSTLQSAVQDNNIEWFGVLSDLGPNFISNPEPSKNSEIEISIRTFKNDAETVYIKTAQNTYPCKKKLSTKNYDYFSAKIRLVEESFDFYFVLSDGNDTDYYATYGMSEEEPPLLSYFKIIPRFTTPKWAKESVFYQIFPDRFYDGNPDNNVKENEYIYLDQNAFTHKKWSELPLFQADFYGGDLNGISNKISYLSDFGINAIYLNPIFESLSNHKYDTKDYNNVDKHFGTNEDLLNLVRLLHNKNIKIILDGVFNHTAERNKWFDKHNEYETIGAFESIQSPFFNFYNFTKWPTDYFCWWGYDTLPKLNYNNIDVRNEIYKNGQDSIAGKYIAKFGIDGWRLDVPNDVGGDGNSNDHSVWKEFRQTIKSLDKDSFITGEIWEHPLAWLKGDQFDSVMGYYTFTEPLSIFLTEKNQKAEKKANYSTAEFDRIMRENRNSLPYPAMMSILNSISSHDIPRFLSKSQDVLIDDKNYSNFEPNSQNVDIFKLAITFQLTYSGAPMVYYGDEVGQVGGKDPDNRRTFPWEYAKDKWRVDLRDYNKKLIELRKTHKSLIYGSFLTILANEGANENGVYAYERFLGNDRIIVILNKSKKTASINLSLFDFENNELLIDYFTQKKYPILNGKLKINIEGLSSVVLVNI